MLSRFLDNFLSNRSLVLTKRDTLHRLVLLLLLCEGIELLERISARQNENQRRCRRRILERLLNIKDRRRQELLTHFLVHVLLHELAKFVGAHGLENEQLHEGTPRSANVLLIWRIDVVRQDLALVQVLPSILILAKVLDQRVKERVSVRVSAKLVPNCVREPVSAWIDQAQRIFQSSHRLNQQLVLHNVELALCDANLRREQEGEE